MASGCPKPLKLKISSSLHVMRGHIPDPKAVLCPTRWLSSSGGCSPSPAELNQLGKDPAGTWRIRKQPRVEGSSAGPWAVSSHCCCWGCSRLCYVPRGINKTRSESRIMQWHLRKTPDTSPSHSGMLPTKETLSSAFPAGIFHHAHPLWAHFSAPMTYFFLSVHSHCISLF